MRFTIFRNQKNSNSMSMQIVERKSLIDSMLVDTADKVVSAYRDIFQALSKPES